MVGLLTSQAARMRTLPLLLLLLLLLLLQHSSERSFVSGCRLMQLVTMHPTYKGTKKTPSAVRTLQMKSDIRTRKTEGTPVHYEHLTTCAGRVMSLH